MSGSMTCCTTVVVMAGAMLGAVTEASANRTGAFGGLNGSIASGGVSCTACHGREMGAGSVQIFGAPRAYEPSTIYDLLIRVADDAQAGGGFQISVEDPAGNHTGTLILSDPVNTQLAPGLSGWVTHTAAGVNNSIANWAAAGNAAEYEVQWQAPAIDEGLLTFWVAGNAINDDAFPFGDHIYLTNVTASAAVACPGDVTGDDVVGVEDLVEVIVAWGACDDCAADLDQDGFVGVSDLIEVIVGWGPC